MYVVIGINAVIGFVIPGIAWQAHLGGLVTGAACAAAIGYLGRPKDLVDRGTPRLHWAGLGAIAVLLVVLAVVKYAARPRLRAVGYTAVIHPQCGQPLWTTRCGGPVRRQRQRVVMRKPAIMKPKPTPRFQRPSCGTGSWLAPEM